MSDTQLHKTQVSILHSLRYAEAERFNALMHPTGHTSDTFKFHLQKLIKLGFVVKLESGIGYQLTASGKEFANILDESKRTPKKQPKLSVLIVASRRAEYGELEYLLQKRSRNPHYGFWGEITDAVHWGESFEKTASRVLLRQTGLIAGFTVRSMRRIRDFSANTEELLEDKLFVVVETITISGELSNNYTGGTNAWMTLASLLKQDKYFASTPEIIQELKTGWPYFAQDISYDEEAY